jgi:hypothetical protein
MSIPAGHDGRESPSLSAEHIEIWRRRPTRKRVGVLEAHASRAFILTVAIVLMIWLAFMLSAALSVVGSSFPGFSASVAEAATPILCATPQCTTSAIQDFEYTAPTGTWAVVGARAASSLSDPDVCVYNDAALTQLRACSSITDQGGVDFAVVDYHHTTGGTDYARILRSGGSGEVCTTLDCGSTTLVLNGSAITTSWTANTVVRAFNLPVGAGTYRVGVVVTSGTADLGLAVFDSDGQANYAAGRPGALAEADARGAGQCEGIYFTAASSDTLGLVLWSNTPGGTANYRIELRSIDKLVANSALSKGGTAQADFLYAPVAPQGWSVLGLKPGLGNPPPDADIKIYSRPDYITQLARSSAEAGVVDFIVANYANVPEDTASVLMISLGPIGGYKIEWTYAPPELIAGTDTPLSMGSHVGLAWRLWMVAGVEYFWRFTPNVGTRGDASLSVYGPRTLEPAFTYGTRADSLAGSDIWGESGTGWSGSTGVEEFSMTPQLTGEHLLYVYQKGSQSVSGTLRVDAPALVGVGEGGALGFAAPRPSPSSGGQSVRFSFDMPASGGTARLVIYNAAGRAVRTLVEGVLPAGPATTTWDGRGASGAAAAPGIYFARLERAGAVTAVRRFVRLD